MAMALNGWHPGERSILSRAGLAEVSAMSYTWIDSYMPEQHRVFYSHNLPFVPLTSIDNEGRPWASLVAGAAGKPGFIKSSSETTLDMDVQFWPGDPMFDNLKSFHSGGKVLTAGLGIEFSTRRRNKFAGHIYDVQDKGPYHKLLRLRVNQAIGNCPKYINVRDLVPHPNTTPSIVRRELHIPKDERLPEEIIQFILNSDTVFVGTSYHAKDADKATFPSHTGMNARGGLPGFVRVLPSDGRTLILPDYSGNRLLTSLGNIEASGLVAMTFLNFETGDIVYLTGQAENLVGPAAQKVMPRQNMLTTMFVTGFVYIRDALPVRQRPGTQVQRSLYSPPIKFLAEEQKNVVSIDDVTVTMTKIKILSPSLAVFSFETSRPVVIKPGQAAVLDFSDLLGKQQYAHMAPGHEKRVNDDRIRTWTVSSSHVDGSAATEGTQTFQLTMREKEGGLITGALFSITRQAAARMPNVLEDARPLGLTVRLVGIAGDFTLPSPTEKSQKKKLLWIAGGIGITPFLSMLSALSSADRTAEYDIDFVLATREPDVLLPLIREALGADNLQSPKMTLHVFTEHQVDPSGFPPSVNIQSHKGRLNESFFSTLDCDPELCQPYVCGPPAFEEMTLRVLLGAGFKSGDIVREGFAY